MIWGESLTNPLLRFTDLRAVAKIAKEKVSTRFTLYAIGAGAIVLVSV